MIQKLDADKEDGSLILLFAGRNGDERSSVCKVKTEN